LVPDVEGLVDGAALLTLVGAVTDADADVLDERAWDDALDGGAWDGEDGLIGGGTTLLELAGKELELEPPGVDAGAEEVGAELEPRAHITCNTVFTWACSAAEQDVVLEHCTTVDVNEVLQRHAGSERLHPTWFAASFAQP